MVKRGHRCTGPKHQEKRSMDYFAGLDVSVKDTSVCIVDSTGKIVREVKVASEPDALLAALRNPAYDFKRIGLEAGPLSQWLFSALAEAELPVICVETRHMRAVLKAQINKTDRNDARGIAQMIRVGLYRPVHVKTLRSQVDGSVYALTSRVEPCLACTLPITFTKLRVQFAPLGTMTFPLMLSGPDASPLIVPVQVTSAAQAAGAPTNVMAAAITRVRRNRTRVANK